MINIKFYDNYEINSKKNIGELNDLKNNSIYTGFINNKFYKPSEIITKEMAVDQVKKANRLIDHHKRSVK